MEHGHNNFQISRFCCLFLWSLVCTADQQASEQLRAAKEGEPQYRGLIIDAGSTGSRIHIYAWKPQPCNLSEQPALVMPTPLGSQSVGSGVTSLDTLNTSLRVLQGYAEQLLANERSDWHRFPLYLLATAGLRRQRPEHRDKVLQALQEDLANWPFYTGPEFVKILSGEEEGAYGWLALNAELGVLNNPGTDSYGVLDLGGASFQITFMPLEGHQVLQQAYPMLLHGRQSNLYAASYLQFGVLEAQRLLQRHLIAHTLMAEAAVDLKHPCLPHGTTYSDVLIGAEEQVGDAPLKAVWNGHGSYEECAEKIRELFDKRAPCFTPPCTFDGRYQPRIGKQRFIAFSTFVSVVTDLALKPDKTTLEDIENAARYVCKMEWETLQDRWRDVPEKRLRTLCFSATYVVVLLHFGLGFDKQDLQIDFNMTSTFGKFSWAYGAMIWAANYWFNPHQPKCVTANQVCPNF